MKLKRNVKCGELREKHIEQKITVNGWVHRRRDLGGLIFIDLRDVSGIVQIVLNPEDNKQLHEKGEGLRSEDVIGIKGKIVKRQNPNPDLPTGQIEIIASEIEIYSKAEVPPFEIEEHKSNASEELRLKYRYMDLRREVMKNNFIMRSNIMKVMGDYLYENNFINIDTPSLLKSTPEGARDFLVPSRLNPGEFYALTQSPQILKQLLMVSGFDRYFQFAKCYRDEDLRAERQLEFIQLDIEMSFCDMDDIIEHTEKLVAKVMKKCYDINVATPFPRMTYVESMERYGNDKPDTRFGMELKDISDIASKSNFKVFNQAVKDGGKVSGICVEGKAGEFSRKKIEDLQKEIAVFGAKGLAWVKYENDKLSGGISKFITEEELKQFIEKFNLKNGDLLLFVADRNKKVVYDSLANLRLLLGKKLDLIDINKRNYLWVVNAPLFEYDEEEKRYVSVHHPFTMPKPEDIPLLNTKPGNVSSLSYDLVLNGVEVAGGSIRIHDKEIQNKVFNVLGFDEESISSQFGFLVDAFKYGVPPHGGIAFGFARFVMILQNASSIRDVISFPKTTSGQCLLSSAPSPIDAKQLDDLKLQLKPKQK